MATNAELVARLTEASALQSKTSSEIAGLKSVVESQSSTINTLQATIALLESEVGQGSADLEAAVGKTLDLAKANDAPIEDTPPA